MRLYGGDGSHGRIDIEHDGHWGTVCDFQFGQLDARVTCRQMGFTDGLVGNHLSIELASLVRISRKWNCPHLTCSRFVVKGADEHHSATMELITISLTPYESLLRRTDYS